MSNQEIAYVQRLAWLAMQARHLSQHATQNIVTLNPYADFTSVKPWENDGVDPFEITQRTATNGVLRKLVAEQLNRF